MKRINCKKRSVIRGLSMAVFLGACLGLQAEDQKNISVDASVNADRTPAEVDQRRAEHDGSLSRGDAKFIKECAQAGLMEVKMGQTAKDHGSSPDVKNFGEKLVKDHTKANEKLSQLAGQKGVNLAREMEVKHTNMIKDMEAKSGPEFDRNFIEHVVKDHKKDISRFEQASRGLDDSELKAFASEMLPTLRAHLTEAQRIARFLGVNITAVDASEYGYDNTRLEPAPRDARGGIRGDLDTGRDASINADVDIDNDKNDGKTLGVDLDRNRDASVRGDVDIDNDKNDGKTLGVDLDRNQDASVRGDVDIDTDKNDGETLGVETRKGDGKVLGIETGPGDGKTLGLNTRKDDGTLLGIFPAPGRDKNDRVDVDVDKSDHRIEVDANVDADRDDSVGAPAGSEKGSARIDAKVDRDDHDYDLKNAKVMVYTDLPKKVQDTIRAEGGSATIKNVKRHTLNGKTAYRVEIPKDGRNRVVHISEDGVVIKDNHK